MKLRHCYIQFAKDEDAEACLFSYKRLKVKEIELKPSRAYSMVETDETDKKLFLKVTSQQDDQDDLERTINVLPSLVRNTSARRASCARRSGFRKGRAPSATSAPRWPTRCCKASRRARSGSTTCCCGPSPTRTATPSSCPA